MLKILQIIPSLRKGGAERLVLDICNELSGRNDIDIKLITFNTNNEYTFLTEKINWEVVPAGVELSLVKKNRFHLEKLQKSIDDFAPHIIHSHLFEAEIVSRLCNYQGAKWYSHGHSNMEQFRNFSLLTLFYKRYFTNYFEKKLLFGGYKANGGNHFITISNDTKQYFEKTSGKYSVAFLPNAINFSLFNTPRQNTSTSDKLRLVNIGSLVDKKNQTFLIDVAIVLKNKNVDFELHLFGDGINRIKLQQKIDDNKLENNVFLRGNVDHVEEYLRNSDLYLHSAFYEPFGLVLLEAMASGLPVICLDGKGNRDIIEEGKNGFMISEQDSELFANKIIELMKTKQLHSEMSRYASDFAKKYDIKEYVDKLLELYNSKLI